MGFFDFLARLFVSGMAKKAVNKLMKKSDMQDAMKQYQEIHRQLKQAEEDLRKATEAREKKCDKK